jgi:hypothetical protein
MTDTATPCHGHAPIQMKRVDDSSSIDNVGEFTWTEVAGIRHILFAIPDPKPHCLDDYVMNQLPVRLGENTPGKSWVWDGNEDAPTLTPSVHCLGHWHGWVRAGALVEA